MLRSIYRAILGAFEPKSGRPRRAPRARRGTHYSGARSRRLTMESLESRELLTVTTLTTGSLSDGSFEAPALPTDGYQIAPNLGSPWQFSGIAGVSANNSAFTNGNPKAPDGAQVGFIKNNASISQTVYLEAGVYNLSMLAAQRTNYQSQPETIEVLVDGSEVGVIQPASSTNAPGEPVGNVYILFQTWNFTVTTGQHNVELLGLCPSTADSTALIDQVAISPAIDTIGDGGFEEPSLPGNAFQTDPGGSAWQFSGTAGIARNGSDFVTNWTTAQDAPAGLQVAYIQETGSMSQTIFLDAGTYQLSYLAAQRAIYQASYQVIEVLVDGSPVGTINPVNDLYGYYQSSTFAVTTGAHTVEFLGLNPQGGDNTAFIDQVTISLNAVADGSFEAPALAPNAYQAAPPASPTSPWQYSGTAGVSRNASAFTLGSPKAPDGNQVAFIKGTGGMSQTVDLDANTYSLSFLAAQRADGQPQSQEIEVLVDGADVGMITPSTKTYLLYYTSNFTVTSGMHTIELVGLNPQGGDNTALIDEVSVTAAQDEVVDGSFETPVLAANAYAVAPSGTAWQFSGLAGVSANGSGVTAGNYRAPSGAQVGFLMNNGSIGQTIDLDAGTYNLSFLACQRVTDQSQPQTIEVLLDGAQIALITPINTTATLSNSTSTPVYTLYQTPNFTVASGAHTIELLGTSPSSGESTALIDQVAIASQEDMFTDGSFEAPVLPVDSYAVAPSGSGWQFSGIAGVSANLSGFTYVTNGKQYAPTGGQVAFIKDTGSMSQSVYFQAGSYNISFLASQRIDYQTQPQTIAVLVDGVQVGLVTPSVSTTPNSTAPNIVYTYTPYQTSNFTVTAGAHTIEFVGQSPSSADSTAFIDAAVINAGSAINDGSFEEPVLAPHAYQVAPSGTPWQFSGVAGISTDLADDRSPFTAGNPYAPNGAQVAFIKDTGSISQSVNLASGVYNLSFMAAQRDEYQTQDQSLEILVDGTEVGLVTPSAPQSPQGAFPAGTTFGAYSTSNFTVTAGVHTITIVGLSPTTADSTALVDNVQLNV